MELKNFMHACTYRTKFYKMTAAVSLAACTCALGLPVDVFAQTAAVPSSHAEKSAQPLVAPAQTPAPAASAAPAPATKHSAASATDRSATSSSDGPVYDTAKNYIQDSADEKSVTYKRKTDFAVDNPFPDVISDDEIKEAFDHNKEYDLSKICFTPDASKAQPNPKKEIVKDTQLKSVSGKYTIYYVLNKFSQDAHPTNLLAMYGGAITGTTAKDGSIYAGSESTVNVRYCPFTFELNGYKIADNCLKMVKIIMPSYQNYTYLKIEYNYSPSSIERMKIFYAAQGSTASSVGVFPHHLLSLSPKADAEFHFVDDLQYRAKNKDGIDAKGKLKQRGNSDDHASLTEEEKKKGFLMSAKPFYEVKGLQDISDTSPITTGLGGYARNNSGDQKTTLLSFEGDRSSQKTGTYASWYIYRPTLADLTDRNIPGYVYWDNDIDKPKGGVFKAGKNGSADQATEEDPGNHYLSFAYEMKDGKPVKRLTRKHYYVTFRALPTRLVVQYKGLDNKIKTDQAFGLYTTQNSSLSLINDKLKSREAPQTKPTKDALVQMMKNANTSFLDKGAGYLSDGFAYLLPGTYMVKPTLKAPDGYEWVIETKETNKKTQADLKVSLQTKEADPTQQVVTFVLKKKPTPAPTPTPYPLPVPEVPAPTPAPAPAPEHKVPALEAPAPKTPAAPAEAPAPLMRKHARTLPQTGDPMAISAVGELGMMLGILSASLAATLRRKRR